MKRILFFVCCMLSSINAYSQKEWEEQPCTFKITTNNNLDILDVSSNGATLYNRIAESKQNKRQNLIHSQNGNLPINIYRYNDLAYRISFNIDDMHNNPSNYKYAVLDESGRTKYTRDIYWGITVYMIGADGKEYNIEYIFSNIGARNYILAYQNASKSFCVSGHTPIRGNFNDGYKHAMGFPSHVEIVLQENELCLIKFDNYSIPNLEIGSIVGVKNIGFNIFAGAKIRVYNLKVEKQSIYAKVSNFIAEGNNKMKAGSYYQATLEYSKAIDKGYKNYDVHFRRAQAYFMTEFYKNAIDDCTAAIYYRSTADVYLLRGKAKLLMGDQSCIEDLEKGGSEGQAILQELNAAVKKDNIDKKSSQSKKLIKDKGFKIN